MSGLFAPEVRKSSPGTTKAIVSRRKCTDSGRSSSSDSVLQALERSDFLAAVGVNADAFSQADRLVSRRITR